MKSNNYYKFSDSLKELCDDSNYIKILRIDDFGFVGDEQKYRIFINTDNDNLADSNQVVFDNKNLCDLGVIFDVLIEKSYEVEIFYIEDVELDKDFVEVIVKLLKGNQAITSLCFDYNNLDYFDIEALELLSDVLSCNKTLRKLMISHNSLNHQDMKIIAELLNVNNSISDLDLSRNSIEDEDAFIVAGMLKNNKIINFLDISNNIIKEKGFKSIFTSLRYNYALQKLVADENDDVNETNIAIAKLLERNNKLSKNIQESIIDYLKYMENSMNGTDFKLTNFVGDKCAFNKLLTPLEYNAYSTNPKIYENFIKKNEPELYQRLSDRFLENSDSDLLDVCIRKPYAYNLFKVLAVSKNCTSNKLLNDHGILTKIDEYLIGDPKSLVKDGMFQIPFCNEIDKDLSKLFGESNEIEDIF